MKSPQKPAQTRSHRRLPDIIAPDAARAATMRAVKSRDTKPEMVVRKFAHAIRPGYRLNRPDISGKPDLAWIAARKAVFVHGCFWHGHDCARGARTPKTNRDYWVAKIGRNVARDRRNVEALEQAAGSRWSSGNAS